MGALALVGKWRIGNMYRISFKSFRFIFSAIILAISLVTLSGVFSTTHATSNEVCSNEAKRKSLENHRF